MADTVALVMDGDFAERFSQLRNCDIWVVGSDANLAAVDRIRATGARATTFQDYGEPLEEAFREIVMTIELHHGEHSQAPPFYRLEVFGLDPNDGVHSSLANIGFEFEKATASGFTARRLPPRT
jgi:hypothetical protein